MARYIKELLIVLYLLKSHDYYLERITAMGFGLPVLLFVAMFIVLVFALLLGAYIRQTFVRHLFALIFFISAVFFDIYGKVTADYLTYNNFISLIYSGGFIRKSVV